jgi:D-aminopeptidase
MMRPLILALAMAALPFHQDSPGPTGDRARAADIGLKVGSLETGPLNAITDVAGVLVGHKTLWRGDSVRTGVTAILPHGGNLFHDKVPAAIHCYNGFGKLAGYLQVRELGTIETPVVLTNTLNVGTAVEAVVAYVLSSDGNEGVRSVNAVVGETNDGYLNDIRGRHVQPADVHEAILAARGGPVAEGSVGAGTGTVAFGYKGGIGTASRRTPPIGGRRYTVGVLVQSNFGRVLQLQGIPFSEAPAAGNEPDPEEGSCMIVIATDAPLSDRNLERLARRSFTGMGRTTRLMSNGSGDFAIAFSTAYTIPHDGLLLPDDLPPLLGNNAMNPLFQAVEEATQEAIYNSLFMARPVTGHQGRHVPAIPLERVQELLHLHGMYQTR